jgi:hypothetical protein
MLKVTHISLSPECIYNRLEEVFIMYCFLQTYIDIYIYKITIDWIFRIDRCVIIRLLKQLSNQKVLSQLKDFKAIVDDLLTADLRGWKHIFMEFYIKNTQITGFTLPFLNFCLDHNSANKY